MSGTGINKLRAREYLELFHSVEVLLREMGDVARIGGRGHSGRMRIEMILFLLFVDKLVYTLMI